MLPSRVPIGRDTLSPEPLAKQGVSIHSFMYVCWRPKKRSPPTYIQEKHMVTVHGDGRPTYSGVQPGSPRGSLTTLVSLPQCHAAFGTITSTLAPQRPNRWESSEYYITRNSDTHVDSVALLRWRTQGTNNGPTTNSKCQWLPEPLTVFSKSSSSLSTSSR
jgi:hypothetical protein